MGINLLEDGRGRSLLVVNPHPLPVHTDHDVDSHGREQVVVVPYRVPLEDELGMRVLDLDDGLVEDDLVEVGVAGVAGGVAVGVAGVVGVADVAVVADDVAVLQADGPEEVGVSVVAVDSSEHSDAGTDVHVAVVDNVVVEVAAAAADVVR